MSLSFNTPTDIANRACQHCGVRQIDPTLGFTEDSVQAGEIGSCYDKLRRAELRRNVWRFATKRAVIRPLDTTTMLLAPELWSSVVTYFPGAVVTTVDGSMWVSTMQDNLNNAPGNSNSWDAYYGTLTCDPWDTTGGTAYFAGDVVYVLNPNGSYAVFLSLVNQNSDNPQTADSWVTAPQYYQADQVVLFNSTLYQSLINLNTGNTPGLAPTIWGSGTAYTAGQQVTGTDAVVYTALVGSTGVNPAGNVNKTTWQASGCSNPAAWLVGTTYSAGQQVAASDGTIYASIAGGNLANNPANGANPTFWTNTGALNPWTTTITNGSGSQNWTQMTVALTPVMVLYPINVGPVSNQMTRNAYRLPAGYLREAPQDPKAGSVSFLGAPTGRMYDDWEKEGDYLITQNAWPIIYRFVADITNVQEMDDMFCEGLGARIGFETAPRLTQDTAKQNLCAQVYKTFMNEARTVNGIETGATEPPEDDYITCRI